MWKTQILIPIGAAISAWGMIGLGTISNHSEDFQPQATVRASRDAAREVGRGADIGTGLASLRSTGRVASPGRAARQQTRLASDLAAPPPRHPSAVLGDGARGPADCPPDSTDEGAVLLHEP